MTKRRKSPEEYAADLDLGADRTPDSPGEPTPTSPTSELAIAAADVEEINRLFELLTEEGYTVAPGYSIQYDEWGRAQVGLTVIPPNAFSDEGEAD